LLRKEAEVDREERYDIVIVGGGHNGITAAAYLAKCGLSVCVLEERPEVGGGQENTEPIPGVSIDPHATLLYAAAAPGFEQLELWKYGFRMAWSPAVQRPGEMYRAGVLTTDGPVPPTQKDMEGLAKLFGIGTSYPFLKELLRAIYWCPPHPQDMEQTVDDVPWVQLLKERAPEVWSESIPQMSLFDLLDEFLETEALKVSFAGGAWYCGAAPHWEGMAIPSFGGIANVLYSRGIPRGGMHHYAHSIVRCAIAHGARIRTCCPVDEIIVSNGRAAGVRLRDNAAWGEKTIWADKAVLSAVDLQQTFLKLIGPRHADASFLQRVKDVSLKGSSLYVGHLLVSERPRYAPKYKKREETAVLVSPGFYPCDSREILLQQAMEVDGGKTTPSLEKGKLFWVALTHEYDSTRCRLPDHLLFSPIYIQLPAPEYHEGGAEAANEMKPAIEAAILRDMGEIFSNVNSDTIAGYWANTPYDSELRNVGLIGGGWYSTRHCSDQWWSQRPLPELARYRTPVDGLYLCHQTSHPGGLCLMAVPYNLMHILIEDGIAEPGDWWYSSPWYVAEKKEKVAAYL
jgi:beta-carotene ketolase (CrtO type)